MSDMDITDTMEKVAMDIILHAGDARNYALEAVSFARKGDFSAAKDKIQCARNSINDAHIIQTNIIQADARGIKHELSMLFVHAQDTLMTIMSEVTVFEEMVHMYQLILCGGDYVE
ncbi:PTS lactose/cellobiose transporter subunit IIA [Erysipelotrichaceae bacterium AF15-26LB]|nr:PTS system, Lactose/Cellobiose specific IIA subunit [Erysipelotrichaceae bacterium 3_1_53]MCR0348109.1 PTS lactose/cellobiose transporter subunit IIA [[Clostridium] innocuum]RJV90937.1 PTS lactose/cellobiose transporter subunit IIA [Erysipelotrichaceae bacterium AF19-24AC]RJV91105.1 PTS lactose/cellobiose transporter subunit IIA [Erysipelotrichaceae bacterium AF15-26LB]